MQELKKRNTDDRMAWILALEKCEKATEGEEIYFTEYEICSEVRIPGVLEYGDDFLLCGILQEKNQRGLYTYAVRVKGIQKEYVFDRDRYSEEGYYFGNHGLIDELIVLFSVYFQSRFYLKATVTGEIAPSIRYIA